MGNILLVEDNKEIRDGIELAFAASQHTLFTAGTIAEARAIVEKDCPHLVLLDVCLPDGDGFSYYSESLAGYDCKVIFLTAKDTEDDIVKGLEIGAQDYITKPFSMRELMARVNRHLSVKDKTIVRVGDVSYDLKKMEVMRAGECILLSGLERKILHLLMMKNGEVVNREEIIDLIWEATGNDVFDHTITVYMKRIREKIGETVISTVKGIGYRVDGELLV